MGNNRISQLSIKVLLIFLVSLSDIGDGQDKVFCRQLNILLERLIHTESSGRARVVSDKGAYGIFQITDVVLKDYNWFYGGEYQLEDMFVYSIALEVFTWHFYRLYKCEWPDNRYRLLFAVNSYYFGRVATLRGWWNPRYCSNILPDMWASFQRGRYFQKHKKYWKTFYLTLDSRLK